MRTPSPLLFFSHTGSYEMMRLGEGVTCVSCRVLALNPSLPFALKSTFPVYFQTEPNPFSFLSPAFGVVIGSVFADWAAPLDFFFDEAHRAPRSSSVAGKGDVVLLFFVFDGHRVRMG